MGRSQGEDVSIGGLSDGRIQNGDMGCSERWICGNVMDLFHVERTVRMSGEMGGGEGQESWKGMDR